MISFTFHPEAEADLNEIWEYIAADNLDAADRVVNEILQTAESLARFPQQGHHRTDLTTAPVRFHQLRKYLIAYIPDQKPLCIIAILHGHRSPRNIAALLRVREH